MTTQQTTTQQTKAENFRQLHDDGCFVIPNFWDPGSAVILERLGFQALATTSAGFAESLGKLDGQVTLEEKLAHTMACAEVTTAPISVDFENGFAHAPEEAATNLERLAETGVVGASIEDWSGTEIYEHTHAVERIAACVEAARSLPFPFTLTARAENLLHGVQDLDDTIARLKAFESAGADVLYAPGLASKDHIEAVLEAVERPINVLFAFMPDTNLSEFAEIGVRRVSLGGALALHAIGATLRAANRILEDGDFTWLFDAAPPKVVKDLLGSPR